MSYFSTTCKYKNTTGVLSIEDQSLVFKRTDGIINKRERIVTSIPIEAIRQMNIEGSFSKKLVITVDRSLIQGIPRHEFKVPDPEQVISHIREEKSTTSTSGTIVSKEKEVHIKEVIVKIPCTRCGTLNESTAIICAGCGASDWID